MIKKPLSLWLSEKSDGIIILEFAFIGRSLDEEAVWMGWENIKG